MGCTQHNHRASRFEQFLSDIKGNMSLGDLNDQFTKDLADFTKTYVEWERTTKDRHNGK
jgi:hypothetical protein